MVDGIGWISFHGFTPSIDFFKDSKIDPQKDDRDLNILMSECSDIRHILHSISGLVPLKEKKAREHKINIYLHEKNLECLARALLFLTLICETSLVRRERMELFMDLYSNTLIRDKTDAYLQGVVNELIQLVTEDERCQSVLKPMIHFD